MIGHANLFHHKWQYAVIQTQRLTLHPTNPPLRLHGQQQTQRRVVLWPQIKISMPSCTHNLFDVFRARTKCFERGNQAIFVVAAATKPVADGRFQFFTGAL